MFYGLTHSNTDHLPARTPVQRQGSQPGLQGVSPPVLSVSLSLSLSRSLSLSFFLSLSFPLLVILIFPRLGRRLAELCILPMCWFALFLTRTSPPQSLLSSAPLPLSAALHQPSL